MRRIKGVSVRQMHDGSGDERKNIFAFSVPIMLELLLTSVIGTGTQYYLNGFSKDAVATVGSLSFITNIVVNLYSLISVGGSILLAPMAGTGNKTKAARLIHVMIRGNFLFGVLCSTLSVVFTFPLMKMMHLDPSLYGMGAQYLIVSCGFSVIQSLLTTYIAIFRSFCQMRSVLAANFIVYISCFTIYYLVPRGYQNLIMYTSTGIMGQILGVLFLAVRLHKTFWNSLTIEEKRGERIRISDFFRILKNILSYGIFGGSEVLVYVAGLTICTSLIGMVGTRALLIKSYLAIIGGYMEIFMTGFSLAAFPLIGQNFGRGDYDKMRKNFSWAVWYSILFTTVTGALFLIFGRNFLRLFTQDKELIRDTMAILILQIIMEVAKAPVAVEAMAMKAIGATVVPFLLDILSGSLEVLTAWLLGIRLGMGLKGIFIGYIVEVSFRSVVLWFIWQKDTREYKIRMMKEKIDKRE